MKQLLKQIKNCTICEPHLALGANPVLRASKSSKIVIIGQAPGTRVHKTGIPWNDPSGVQLRKWLNVSEETFYNEKLFAIIPMGFCYPGKGKSGDLPPRKECAPTWHEPLFNLMPNLEMLILIGMYAQNYYLKNEAKQTLTETVKNYQEYLPNYFVLPHPSPRNRLWQKKNPWFEKEVVPKLQETIRFLV